LLPSEALDPSQDVTMSLVLWDKLPGGFLKMKYGGWARLDHDVRRVIVELAQEQGFKCAHCMRVGNLIIEHDHYPEHGRGNRYTTYNIRGLVCQRCNWHLMLYEQDQNGGYRGFDEAFSYISDREYESYIHAYDCRVNRLYEQSIERKMGSLKYLRRRIVLDKFDDWNEWSGSYPWHWGFDEIKDKKYGKIRTPRQFIKALAACVLFVKGELEKDPDYQVPKKFLELIFRIKPALDELRPIIEARLVEIGKINDAAALRAHPPIICK
jgi:Recombination endonuclease VII